MYLYLILLLFVVGGFAVHYYFNYLEVRKFEKYTQPSKFLKTRGHFIKDQLVSNDDALFQSSGDQVLGSRLSYLQLEEPSFSDSDARFGGTNIAANQAIIIRGLHDLDFFGLSVLDSDEKIIDKTFIPKSGEDFAFIVLRSELLAKVIDKKLGRYEKRYVFLGDSYPTFEKVSIVLERLSKDASKTSLLCEKLTLVSLESPLRSEVIYSKEHKLESNVDENKIESVLSKYFFNNHSIEKVLKLEEVESELGGVYRQVSEPIEFNQNTFVSIMTTKRDNETLQFGIVDENNRVVCSTFDHTIKCDDATEPSDDSDVSSHEQIVNAELSPGISGRYRTFSASYCDLAIMKPVSVIIAGTRTK